MKISQKGLYALQAMMMLARHYHQGAIKIRDVAYEENLPEKFLELILLELKNARIVESVGQHPAHGRRGAKRMKRGWSFLAGLAVCLITSVLGWAQGSVTTIRVGAFPNITHSQAMVGKATGFFEKALGPGVKIEWKTFNAGPAAVEALFAGAIDMTYVGPNPAIQGYVRSNGEALRIVAGWTSCGARFVGRNGSGS